MKCKRKEIFDYAPVNYVLLVNPPQNPNLNSIPDWIYDAFKSGVLRYRQGGNGMAMLEVQQSSPLGNVYAAAPTNGYLVALQDEIRVLAQKAFETAYEIID